MFVKSHLGRAYITESNGRYRVELLDRRVVCFGDSLSIQHGRLLLEEKRVVTLLLEQVTIIPAISLTLQKVVGR
ncbi:hypothetical protein JK635_08005 [Neobacillus sp. YIM B02564]|uniref:Uncharacterized protein n=1 Tax=Neobacillus paridis TaxID=2803862 RepID=A0ABS1TN53_9BACI|nr:hypothetical protein [Neobacillus paridis]MBL4952154.1 hypothetical protein [Neobacillus paridis]